MKPAVLLACAAALAATTARADCPAGAPTGYYEGEAASADIGKVSATLDLVCEDGACHARPFTGMGEFAVKDIKAETGKASFAIDTGASLGRGAVRRGHRPGPGPAGDQIGLVETQPPKSA
jgi:hypothetical protein